MQFIGFYCAGVTFRTEENQNVKTFDEKLFLIKLQWEDGKSYSSIHTLRGMLRPAFQMAVADNILVKKHSDFSLWMLW